MTANAVYLPLHRLTRCLIELGHSVKWEQRESLAKPTLVTALDHIGFGDSSGTADAILQESWDDILPCP